MNEQSPLAGVQLAGVLRADELLTVALLCAFLVATPALAQQATIDPAADALPGTLAGNDSIEQKGTITTRVIEVAEGDTLFSLARREFGSGGLAWSLAEFNGLDPDAVLKPGQKLRVPIHVPARLEVARVVFVKGRVQRAGIPLEREALVAVGDVVETGDDGFASLEFSSGSVVNLQPDTTASITRLSCLEDDARCVVEIETGSGSMNSNVEARDGQPLEFRIFTPFAAAAVRGTVFDFSADPQSLRTAVTEGEVVIEAQQQEVQLETGFGSVTIEGEPPGAPVSLLRPPVFRTLPVRAAAGDQLGWFPLSAAASYAGTFSLDVAGVETVAALDSDGETVLLPPSIDSGDYFLSLRGIDGSGLPGFPATVRLTVAELNADVEPVETLVTRDASEFVVEVLDPPSDAAGFEIQVSTTEGFEDPLSIDVTPAGRAILSLDADTLYARARTLIDPQTVSTFGPISSGN